MRGESEVEIEYEYVFDLQDEKMKNIVSELKNSLPLRSLEAASLIEKLLLENTKLPEKEAKEAAFAFLQLLEEEKIISVERRGNFTVIVSSSSESCSQPCIGAEKGAGEPYPANKEHREHGAARGTPGLAGLQGGGCGDLPAIK